MPGDLGIEPVTTGGGAAGIRAGAEGGGCRSLAPGYSPEHSLRGDLTIGSRSCSEVAGTTSRITGSAFGPGIRSKRRAGSQAAFSDSLAHPLHQPPPRNHLPQEVLDRETPDPVHPHPFTSPVQHGGVRFGVVASEGTQRPQVGGVHGAAFLTSNAWKPFGP